MRSPAVGDELLAARDRVLVAKARTANLADAGMDSEPVVEPRGRPIPHMGLEHERLEPLFAERVVAAGVLGEVRDAGDLEPDEIRRVVRDALRVGLGEAHANLGLEREPLHRGHSTRVDPDVLRLAELVETTQPCVALTGAGISTESGIPDFRSPTGIWAEYDPMEYATIAAFRRDPRKVWEFYTLRFEALTRAEPNDGHRALAELEASGWVRAVVTQNIDTLHERAGSRDVVEVHGSIREAECLHCGERVPLGRVVELLAEGAAPECPSCGDALKPGVVLFGELLPEHAIERAYELARESRLLLVVGSSLEVHPVAGLPDVALAAGGALAIVNRGSTPYDALAEVRIDGGAGGVLSALVDALATRRRRA